MNAVVASQDHAITVHAMTTEQVELVKRTICKGADGVEPDVFYVLKSGEFVRWEAAS